MKSLNSAGCGVCVAVSVAACLFAQPKEPPVKPTVDEMKQHMEAMAALAEPGPMNALLAARAGEYTITIQMWMNADDRSGTPLESRGEATLRAVLGGRFLVQEETATLAGEKISSIKYWGYSKDLKQFEAMWAYTGSTSMMIFSGSSVDDGRTVAYTSTMTVAGQKERIDVTVRQVSAESFSIELVGSMEDGTKGAALVSTYTRKK